MPKTAAVAWSIVALVLAIYLVASGTLSDTANYIDTTHWVGNPLPPCFVDAKACGGHLLGTDEVGRDMLARLVVGTRTTLIVSICALLCASVVAFALALLARRFTAAKAVLGRVAAAISSVSPWPYLVILAAVSPAKRDPLVGGLWLAFWAGVVCWPALWRLMMSDESVRPVVRKAAREWSMLILTFVTVDFFGFGIQPPLPSLGNMLASLQANMQSAWWAAVMPAVVVFLLVLAIEGAARVGDTSSEGAA